MALLDTDFFLVNRNQESYKMPASVLSAYVAGATVHVGENPPADQPSQGDLWWKSDVGILYVYYIDENTSQWVQAAGGGGAGGSGDGANVSTGIEPPLNAANGDLWFRTDNGRLYVYYTDGDGTNQWVDVSGGTSADGGDGGGDGIDLQAVTDNGNTTTNGAAFGGDIQSTSQNGGQLAGFRNQLINGDFLIVQRGAGGEAGVARRYTCDRWYVHNDGAQTYTWDQIDAPAAFVAAGFTKALRVRNASDVYQVRQLIELPEAGQRGQFVEGSIWTLSIYANAAVSCQVQWRDDSTGDPGAATGIIPLTAMTDEGGSRYTLTFTMPATAPQATALGLGISFLRTDGANTGLQVTGAQFEPGPVATPFEHRPIGTELALCQRYFFKNDGVLVSILPNTSNSNQGRVISTFRPVEMRVTPTEDIPIPSNGTVDASKPTANTIRINYTASNSNNNIVLNEDYTADAEL